MTRQAGGSAMNRQRSDVWIIYSIVVLAVSLVMISIAGILIASVSPPEETEQLFSLAHYGEVFGNPDLYKVIGRTLLLGLGSIAFMLAFSLPISWILARTDYKRKNLLFSLLIANIAIPGFIKAMSYVFLFNPTAGIVNKLVTPLVGEALFNVYSLPWICYLQGLLMTPIAVFMIYPALRNMDGSLEEACWTSGLSRWQAVRYVVFPLVAPAIAAASLFFFILAIEIFDVVALVGLPGKIVVLSGMIYDATHPTYGLPNYGKAGVLGVILFLIAGVAIAFYLKLLVQAQRYQVVGAKIRHVQQELSGKGKLLADCFIGVWIFLSFVIPLFTLFWTSLVPYLQPPSLKALDTLSFKSYSVALAYMIEPMKNTLFVMVTSVILAVVLSVCVSWLVTRTKSRLAPVVEFIVFLSIAVPSMVSAVAFQFIALKLYSIIPLYGSIVLVVLVLASRMLTFTTRTINGTALQLNQELDEAAYTSGLSRFTAFRKVFLPLVTPAVVYSAFVVAVLAARDLTVPLMVNTGNKELVSTLIYHLQANGSYDVASAVGFYLMVFLLVLVLLARRLTGLRQL